MLINCPRCGFQQPKDKYCAQCGVDMETFKPASPPALKRFFETPSFNFIACCRRRWRRCHPLSKGSAKLRTSCDLFKINRANQRGLQSICRSFARSYRSTITFSRSSITSSNRCGSKMPPMELSTHIKWQPPLRHPLLRRQHPEQKKTLAVSPKLQHHISLFTMLKSVVILWIASQTPVVTRVNL